MDLLSEELQIKANIDKRVNEKQTFIDRTTFVIKASILLPLFLLTCFLFSFLTLYLKRNAASGTLIADMLRPFERIKFYTLEHGPKRKQNKFHFIYNMFIDFDILVSYVGFSLLLNDFSTKEQ